MLFSVHWGYFLPMMDGQKWPVYAVFHRSTGTDKSGAYTLQAIFCPCHDTGHVNIGLRFRVKFMVRVS